MSEESWTENLELPRTEARLVELIGMTETLLAGILIALNVIDPQKTPELFQQVSRAQEKAQYCLENFHQQLAHRRQLMGDDDYNAV